MNSRYWLSRPERMSHCINNLIFISVFLSPIHLLGSELFRGLTDAATPMMTGRQQCFPISRDPSTERMPGLRWDAL